MGFRVHRSKQILPGVRVNMSKSGFGLSVGKPGARVSINPKGEVKTTVGIPGSGISHSRKVGQITKPQVKPVVKTPVTQKPVAKTSPATISTLHFWLYAAIAILAIGFIGTILTR